MAARQNAPHIAAALARSSTQLEMPAASSRTSRLTSVPTVPTLPARARLRRKRSKGGISRGHRPDCLRLVLGSLYRFSQPRNRPLHLSQPAFLLFDSGSLFLYLAVLFEELVEQHRIHGF